MSGAHPLLSGFYVILDKGEKLPWYPNQEGMPSSSLLIQKALADFHSFSWGFCYTADMKRILTIRRHLGINLAEVHQYVNDLDRITLLRDKASNEAEKQQYDEVLYVMQKVMVEINKL